MGGAPRTHSTAELGHIIEAPRVIVGTITRPSVHKGRIARIVRLHTRIAKKKPSRPRPPIAMESPLHVLPWGLTGTDVPERPYGRSFSPNVEMGGHFVSARDDSVVVLDSGATADLVYFKWLGNPMS